MKEIIQYAYVLFLLFILETIYLRLARYFKIEAVPNSRSAHSVPTLVGGGIIIPLSCILYFFWSGFTYSFWMTGMFCIATVSFIDDLKEVPVTLRLLSQAAVIAVMFFQFDVYSYPITIVLIIAMAMIISLNTYNFLDGINGMMSANSLVHLAFLFYINRYNVNFINEDLLITVIIAVVVFSFFNFRAKAICFSGDVGSISLAFFICSCILKLIIASQNIIYIGLLLVYYLDAVTTFVFRWYQGHNVFKAHKKHFYLHLVNDRGWPHLAVALLYAFTQLMISLVILIFFKNNSDSINYYNIPSTAFIIIMAVAATVLLRVCLEGNKILRRYNLQSIDQDQNKQEVTFLH